VETKKKIERLHKGVSVRRKGLGEELVLSLKIKSKLSQEKEEVIHIRVQTGANGTISDRESKHAEWLRGKTSFS